MGETVPDGVLRDVPRRGSEWGDWRLGDLSDALQSASRALGPSARVGWLAVYPPTMADHLPVVQLAAEDPEELEVMRSALSGVGDVLVPLDGHPERNFEAVAGDVLVHVWVKG